MKRVTSIIVALALVFGLMSHLAVGGAFVEEVMAATQNIGVDINGSENRSNLKSPDFNDFTLTGNTSPASKTIDGVTFELTSSTGSFSKSQNKTLITTTNTPYLTTDGAFIDSDGATITLTISGLSSGTHTLTTWHSYFTTKPSSIGKLAISVNGSQKATVTPSAQVTDDMKAGISYVSFTGTSATITIKQASGSSGYDMPVLNAFEIDGPHPTMSISNPSPEQDDLHVDTSKGLSWTAGNGAVKHDVYLGTNESSVTNATTSSSEYKGRISKTSYAFTEELSHMNDYYWRVDEVDSSGNVVKGKVYHFKPRHLAFPTAEGYGRFAIGGRGGYVYEVTTLEDTGTAGSLRYGLETLKGARIIVFRVGGVIELKSKLCIPDDGGNVYVAGQTAPGDGITLIKHDFGALGASDVVIRDVRVRVGDSNGQSTGGMGMGSCDHSIVDHCSISWATDEGFSSRGAKNLTFQYNIIGESLHDSVHYNADDRTQTEPHAFAASISGKIGSFHHNLLINCTGRNWSLAGAVESDNVTYGGSLDISNNVVYNWRDRTTDGGVRRLNFVNNYYKMGASSRDMQLVTVDGDQLGTGDCQMMYVSGNMLVKSDGSTILKASDDAWAKGYAAAGSWGTEAKCRSNSPFFANYITLESAENAYKTVIAEAGANYPNWDYIDSRYIKEVTNGTYTYKGSKQGISGIIDSQTDAGGYPGSSNFKGGTAPTDSDHDGMPDSWENKHGLNANDAADGKVISLSGDGYTNVEVYLNELMGDPIVWANSSQTPVTGGVSDVVFDTELKYAFRNYGSNLYLEVADGVAAAGSNVQQGNGDIAEACTWTLKDGGDGYYYILSQLGDGNTYFLDVANGSTGNGTNIGIWTYTSHDAQLFKFVDNGDGTYRIGTKVTGGASGLGVASGSTAVGANVIQWERDGTPNQSWIIEPIHNLMSGSLIKSLVVKDETYASYWGIDSSLQVGDKAFGDRAVTFVAIDESLVGSEYIVTSCDSKKTTTDLAVVTAAKDIIISVGFDHRLANIPAWASGFEESGLTLTGSNDVVFNIYQKELKAGESITLGAQGQSSGVVGYIAMATLKPVTTVTPTAAPTAVPTAAPTVAPTAVPTAAPTVAPTATPKPIDDSLLSKPFEVKDGLFDQSRNNEDLGLSKIDGAEVVTVYTASDNTDKFVNGVVMTEFKGKLYCQWQSSAKDEDSEDTWVAYSVSSDDGKTWSAPKVLAPSIDNGYCSSGGWYVNGDTIVAYINQWPDDVSPRGGYTYYTQSTDGVNWTTPAPVLMKDGSVLNGIFEQDPHVLDSGRIVCSAHFQNGLFVNPIYTDDESGVKGWVKADYTNMSQSEDATTSREMEPSLFVNEDGNLVMIFRDQNSTYKVLAAVSTDQGESWSDAVLTNMPDARQKQSAGNLPDGTAYIVSCPVDNKLRLPLTITLSADGKTFDKAYVLGLGSEISATVMYEGTAKRQGYHYPKSVVIGNYLYVSYAKNKEYAEYVRIPLEKICLNGYVPATPVPTATPTVAPTATPTVAPTATPTAAPTATPTAAPTATPTAAPTATPTVAPTATPTVAPTATPTVAPTATPTATPTAAPTATPTVAPTVAPTATPTVAPTATPTATPNPDAITGTVVKEVLVKDEKYRESWSIDSSLKVGDLIFGDRAFTFTEIDSSLVGSEYIVTACDSKFTTTDLAVVTAAEDMILYVGFDQRLTTIPSWASGFTKTSMTCKASNDVVFVIYQKVLEAGESITLGSQGRSSGVVGYIAMATVMSDTFKGDIIKNVLVQDEENREYWSLDSDLSVGDLIFGDRAFTFTEVDSSLVGSEYIVTACDSKFVTTDLGIVTAEMDMVLSVGFDQRLTVIPSWASEFTKTDITCKASNDVVFVIYQKQVKAGESVLLGSQGISKSVVGYIAMAAPAGTVKAMTGNIVNKVFVQDEQYGEYWNMDSDLSVGDLIFGDRAFTFTEVDSSLVGSEYIVTACDSKRTTTDLGTIIASEDMVLSVGFDARLTEIPAWASEFTKTNITCKASNDVVFVIYQRKVKAGEYVVLGSQGRSLGVVGYIVMVTSLED